MMGAPLPDVFLSYTRDDQAVAQRFAEALQAEHLSVWWDVTLRSGEAYDQVTEKALAEAKAVVVLWSKKSVESRWVRAEATLASRNKTLVPAMIEPCQRPIMFELIQTADLSQWHGDPGDAIWRSFLGDLRRFVEKSGSATDGVVPATVAAPPKYTQPESKGSARQAICVLPFANMSDDPQQEYFSDGITEDIITDLSKISALSVISRNSAFAFKGKNVEVPQVARQLKVTHVLEGSVRKAGGRVRITAQLIDAGRNDHVWAERYDRNLDDIFALQDEISQAIVKALRVKLLPQEKKAIEHRGTENVEAYNLYLMARQTYATGLEGDPKRAASMIRLCQRAVEIDPNYANAWTVMALGQMILRANHGGGGDGGLAAAERALSLDPNVAAAHAVKARILTEESRPEEGVAEIQAALKLDPESYEVNKAAALLSFGQRRFEDAIRYWTKAIALMELDFASGGMLITCYTAIGDRQAALHAAEITLERCEKVLAQDRNNGAAMGHGSIALAVLGRGEDAKEWMNRALLVEPDNLDMRYNFACTFAIHLKDADAALEMLAPVLSKVTIAFINHAKVDPDLDSLRGDPRFQAMMDAADARLETEARGGADA